MKTKRLPAASATSAASAASEVTVVGPHVEVRAELAASDVRDHVALELARDDGVAARERALELVAHRSLQAGTVDAGRRRTREAVLAEAEAEQVARLRPELDQVPLVLVAVLGRVVVERLGEDRPDVVAAHVGHERARVRAHVGMRRAEVGRVAVAEGVDGDAVLVLVGPVGVQEDRPRVDAHAARGRRAARLPEHVPLERLGIDPRLEPAVAGEVGREVERAARRAAAPSAAGCAGRRRARRGTRTRA